MVGLEFVQQGHNFGSPAVYKQANVCAGNHGVWRCKDFQDQGVSERWEIAKDKRLCFRCLGSDHKEELVPG